MLDRARLLAAIAFVLISCEVDPYHLAGEVDGSVSIDAAPRPDARVSPDAGVPDGPLADGCVPEPEACDGQDNDCDGQVDEGFDLTMDPKHCGACGNKCFRTNMSGTCVDSTCQYECLPGFWDLNGNQDDGCEYPCIPTNGGVESCDFHDNDCDGATDEDFDLATDVENCGGCGSPCVPLHATPVCTGGMCGYSDCHPGYADLLPAVAGCEYTCPVWPPQPEACNNVDDDCDGLIDDGNPGGGAPCEVSPGVGDTGACELGSTICLFGSLVCSGGKGPATEMCDEIDNDCDGVTDDGFDKMNDVYHCGGCAPCSLPHAIPSCTGGACTVLACHAGWVDLDGDPSNGCEYSCIPSGPETCDGVDNDCDGLVDAADPSLVVPSNFCNAQGACAGTTPVCGATACDPSVRWRCVYAAPAEVDACGSLAVNETRCDDIDGDCDGAVDDSYPLKGTGCDDGDVGLCKGTGALVCNGTGDGLVCHITHPGASPTAEVCNALDDDCDGMVDEGAPDDVVHVAFDGMNFWIYRYEAARPDATASSGGVAGHRACSKPGVLPWRGVTWSEAAAACAAAGKRLCTAEEWQAACAGPTGKAYPYGDTYQPNACNGNDYDPDCSPPDDDVCLPTGTAYGCPKPASSLCVSDVGAHDLSGNLKEWTATQVTVSPPSYRIRGGAYDNVAAGLTCHFNFLSAEPDYQFQNLGFRCCSDTP